jgi:hypothetical protein
MDELMKIYIKQQELTNTAIAQSIALMDTVQKLRDLPLDFQTEWGKVRLLIKPNEK